MTFAAPGPSPSLTSDSIARSKSPLRPLSTLELRLSSGNPISFKVTSFHSIPSSVTPMLAPKMRDCLLFWVGELTLSEVDVFLERWRAEEEDLKPNPNLRPGLGGGGGGWSSELPVPPVCTRAVGCLAAAPAMYDFCSYFCLMKRSIAESTSSTSRGIGGFVFEGLKFLLELALPTFLIFYRVA